MTEYYKHLLIGSIFIALLVLPSSAAASVTMSTENSEINTFSEDPAWYDYYELIGDFNGDKEKDPVTEIPADSFPFPLIAYDNNITTTKNTPVEITLAVTGMASDPISYTIDSGPFQGTLGTITGNKVVYTPGPDNTEGDMFLFSAHKGTWDSNAAMVTITIEQDTGTQVSQSFYGTVTIEGMAAPANTTILAVGRGVCSNITGNPVTTQADGSFGSASFNAQNLFVQGPIENGTPLTFYVNGIPAEVCEVTTSGAWQPSYPFSSGEITPLDLRLSQTLPPPDVVAITAMEIRISNSTFGYSQKLIVEKNPSIELTVTRGMFDIEISATAVHAFYGKPVHRREAIFGMYENGEPVTVERNVWFGSREVSYRYLANETRSFDIIIAVNQEPEIMEMKHLTIFSI
jgi:hypothetical protein